MRTGRKEVSYVAAGKSVRISIAINHDSLTREELARATDELASSAMLTLASARYVNAPLSKIKVR